MRISRSLILLCGLLATLLAAVACAQPAATPSPKPAPAPTTSAPSPAPAPAQTPTPTAKPAPTTPAAVDPATVLPKMNYWSGWDVGSLAYVQAAGMADAFMKKYNVKVRIIPSGTGTSVLSPIRMGTAAIAFHNDDTYYAQNAMFDYAAYNWGPIPLRVLMAHPAGIGIVTAGDANIKTAYDFKGKRLGYVLGNPSGNQSIDAALAFANLTWKDVTKVEFPSYTAALNGLIQGKVDGYKGSPTAPLLYELEKSPRGIRWPEFAANDKAGWERLQKIQPWVYARAETAGAGMSKEKPANIWGYRYPQIITLASTDEAQVYAITKALDESYGLYKDLTPVMWEWKADLSGVPLAGAPFHKGAIKYFKEKGIWTPAHDEWNNKYLAQIDKIEKAWKTVVDEAADKKIQEKDFPAYWEKRRAELGGNPF